MQNAFVPKNRRPKFDLHLRILDLNNVPYVSGRSYVKYHLPTSSTEKTSDHAGRTPRVPIKDHKVAYNYETLISTRLTISKDGVLQDTFLDFRIIHEVSHAEKILLGTLRLNLAEYVDASEEGGDGGEGVVRRYLMHESKINSTVKIGVFLKQIDGDRGFTAPALKVAPVFSGIAGLVVGEVEDSDGLTNSTGGGTQGVNSKHTQAGDELRELYRRTIAANWTCLPGELSADKVVEDIFAGGDGWLSKPATSGHNSAGKGMGITRLPEDDGHSNHGHERTKSGKPSIFAHLSSRSRSRQDMQRRSRENVHHSHSHSHSPMRNGGGGIRGRGSFEQQDRNMGAAAEDGALRLANEFDELEIRDDLRSWKMPT